MKNTIKMFLILFTLVFISAQNQDTGTKFKELMKEKKYDAALAVVDQAISKDGETYELLSMKFRVLTSLEKTDAALETAIKREDKNPKKSPWGIIDIVKIYLQKGNYEEADKYIWKAIDKGFITITELDEDIQAQVKALKNYNEYVKKINSNIGIGKQAKDFTYKTVNAVEGSLSKLQGKVVLVDFWATWCPPCRKEMPNLIKLYNEVNSKGFEIVGISLDNDGSKLDAYVKENNLKWNIVYSGKAWGDDIAGLYGVNSIPSVWLVDKKGNLRYFDVHGEDLAAKVKELLSE